MYSPDQSAPLISFVGIDQRAVDYFLSSGFPSTEPPLLPDGSAPELRRPAALLQPPPRPVLPLSGLGVCGAGLRAGSAQGPPDPPPQNHPRRGRSPPRLQPHPAAQRCQEHAGTSDHRGLVLTLLQLYYAHTASTEHQSLMEVNCWSPRSTNTCKHFEM